VVPALFLFVAEQPRQTLGEGQEAEEAELGQGTGVDPARGGDDHPVELFWREARRPHLLPRTCARSLDPLDLRRPPNDFSEHFR
jgi:hypothetical protein